MPKRKRLTPWSSEDGSHRLIRRAETPRDYFATLDFLPFMKPLLGEYNDD